MVTIIGVRFRCAGKVYYFDPGQQEIRKNTKVIVETARGLEMGTVVLGNKQVEEESVVQPLKPVIRLATEEDLETVEKNREKEKRAFQICKEKIAKHGLEMKLVDVEYTFDNNKILFYFTADGRIDFRELVKDLASVFKTRIELRQIGVRDETKLLGGVGICGRSLCCHSYLSEFAPVSIKMAKEQNLSLNPSKISGVCGRLMCCLKNEQETYEYLNSRLPALGDTVVHKGDGVRGTVQSVNVLRQLVKVVITQEGDDVEVREYPLYELRYKPNRKKGKEGKENRESREEKDFQEEGENLEEKDSQESREHPEGKKPRGNRERPEGREPRGNRERSEGREHRENRERSEGREHRENREHPEGREHRENREHPEGREHRENREHPEGREHRERRERHRDRRREHREKREDRRNPEAQSQAPQPEQTAPVLSAASQPQAAAPASGEETPHES